MVGRPPIHQWAVATRVHEHYPAGAAAEGLSHRRELGTPALDAAEVAFERSGKRARGPVAFAEIREVQLVQDHGIGRNQLLALQPIDEKNRRTREIQLAELLGDAVQPLHRAAVVVLVMTEDQALGKTGEALGLEGQRLQFVGHGNLLIGYRFQRDATSATRASTRRKAANSARS